MFSGVCEEAPSRAALTRVRAYVAPQLSLRRWQSLPFFGLF
jgi:hypothetical protein